MQVVWALLQSFLFRVKCTLAIDVIFLQSFNNYTRGHPGSVQGPLGLQLIAIPLSYIPAAYRFNNITANTLRLFEHWYQGFCSESSVLSRSMSFFSSLSKIIQRGHPGSNQVPLGLQPNALPLSYIPAANRFQNITANMCRLFEHCYKVFCSESSVLSRSMSFFSSLSIIIQGGTLVRSRDLSDCSWLLYHWAISPLHTDSKISLQTRSGCLSTGTRVFVPSQVYSRDRCHFSLVFQKLYKGDIRVRSRDLSDCSRMLYHWAISPLQTDSKTSLQTRAGCLSTVTMFFVPSQVYSRDRCHFSLVFQNLYKGTPGLKPGTSQTAAECSTTELYPRCKQIPKHHCKHVQVVWALLQSFLFRVKCTLAIDVIFL